MILLFIEHRYKMMSGLKPEGERTMLFYYNARVDGLVKRIETLTELTEEYTNRDDFLVYRSVVFGQRPKKFAPSTSEVASRTIEVCVCIS